MIGYTIEQSDPAFSISMDPARKFVRIIMRSFWTIADQERFAAILRAMLRTFGRQGCQIGTQVTLIDLRDFPAQSTDVLSRLAQMTADRSIGSRRIAILLSSQLLKMQARRTAPDYSLFEDEAAAMVWLAENHAAGQVEPS